MDTLLQDLRYGARRLLQNPGFTLVTVLTLALGIGANTAVFSIVNSVLLKSVPIKNPDRIVVLWENQLEQGWKREGPLGINYLDWRQQNRSFEELTVIEHGSATLTGLGEPEQVPGMRAAANFFAFIGAQPVQGRGFSAEEGEAEGHNVLVISHGFWQRHFGSDPRVVGRTLTVDGLPYTVIGILPATFWSPIPCDVIAPLSDEKLKSVGSNLGVLGRLKPGVTVEQARQEMNALAQRLEPLRPNRKGWGVTVVPLKEAMVEYIRPALLVLLGAVGFVLLIGCANVANLLLARATGRQKEMAIRAALGATRFRVVLQLLTESVLLALMGGAAGLLLAVWTLGLLTGVVPRSIPIPDAAVEVLVKQIEIDGRVLAFTLLVSLVTGVVFGLVPALQASRSELQETLKQTGRTATGDLPRHRLRHALVATEIALALILLIGAGLLLKSFERLQHVNPGFRSERVLTMQMELPTDSKYRTGHEQSAFFHQMLERVQALPGVQAAGLTEITPLSQEETSRGFEVENRPPLAPGHFTAAQYRRISPNYFSTLGIPLIKGRAFADRDDADAPGVAVISATMARRYWPNEDPLGKKLIIRDGGRNPREVIGVVGDVKHIGLDKQPQPVMYVPVAQRPVDRMTLVVRTAADPRQMINAVQGAVWSVDKDQPVFKIQTLAQIVAASVAAPRFAWILLGVFAGLALLLAAVGIYGVMAYTVTQRTQEIGIRMALGAQSSDLLRLLFLHGAKLTILGVTAGVLGALALTRLMGNLLFGVSATDPAIFVGVTFFLAAVALLASYLPARKATKVDPLEALRCE